MSVQPASSVQGALNSAMWAGGTFVKEYSGRELRPIEVLLLIRYRQELSGRVLELGCGAGRITGYLIDLAKEANAIDISAAMIAVCRRRYPTGNFFDGDVRDLSRFDDASLEVVVAGCNLLDIFSDAERRRTLREIRRILVDDGLLIMSSHNRAYLPKVRRPTQVRVSGPRPFAIDVLRAPRRIRRHRRLVGLEREGPDYAIVSDGAHEFSLVHYFTDSRAQARQFQQEGFEQLLSADLDGRPLEDGYQAPSCPEIHYVARKVPQG